MISKTYGRQHNMIICPLPDFETDEAWVDHIRQVVYDLSYDDSKNWIVLQNIKTTSKNWKLLNLPKFIVRRIKIF
jgi:hypothetical protein